MPAPNPAAAQHSRQPDAAAAAPPLAANTGWIAHLLRLLRLQVRHLGLQLFHAQRCCRRAQLCKGRGEARTTYRVASVQRSHWV